jgi:hypothetical protein
MMCDEAAECVSALCDGEVIPREAAAHIGVCAPCRALLLEYMEMGAELRRAASLEIEECVSPRIWTKPQGTFAIWWQKGWGDMKIPRLAFAALVGAIVVLVSTLAVVKVGAHSDGTVVVLKIAKPEGDPIVCALSIQDKTQATCASIGGMNGKAVGYQIDLVGRAGSRVELAVRSKIFGPLSSGSFGLSDVQNEPARQVFFEPGQTLKLDLAGAGTLTITGEWFDHVPAFIGSSSQLDPGPGELRMVSPLLLSGQQVLGDMQGGSTIADKAGWGVVVYMPGAGRFILSLSPMQGAAQADVAFNRISFQDSGRSYTFVNGSPATRAKSIWVLHEADYKPLGHGEEHGFIGITDVTQSVPSATKSQ